MKTFTSLTDFNDSTVLPRRYLYRVNLTLDDARLFVDGKFKQFAVEVLHRIKSRWGKIQIPLRVSDLGYKEWRAMRRRIYERCKEAGSQGNVRIFVYFELDEEKEPVVELQIVTTT